MAMEVAGCTSKVHPRFNFYVHGNVYQILIFLYVSNVYPKVKISNYMSNVSE